MSLLHEPRVAGWFRGHLVCRVDDSAGRFALTFDDGPSPAHTPRLLEILRRYHARATFFVLRGGALRWPALLRRVAEAGHEIGAHGDWHLPMPITPPVLVRRELLVCARAIEATGVPRPRFYRPPFGLMLPSQAACARALGFEPVLGDVYPEDPQRPGVAKIVSRTLRRLREGSIVILHDGSAWIPGDRSQTVRAVEIILAEAAEKGLRAVTVGELLDGVEKSAAPGA
jgi:peptidoglycan/xylan/chitin deacetylase (PgdA/CDA1 family)